MTDRPPGRDDATSTSRRRFLRWLGFAGLVAGATPVAFAAPSSRVNPGRKPAATPARDTTVVPPADTSRAARTAPAEPSADARSLAEVIERRYGKQLSKPQLESITRDLDGDLRGGARLKEVKLANGDEPDVTFRA